MANQPDFPRLETHLPDLMDFVTTLAQMFEAGQLNSWQAMADRVGAFFTPEMMAQVEAVAPGWREMSTYRNRITLVHVMVVFTGLLLCPEYRHATAEQQALIKWIVLFHDIAKEAKQGRRDNTHGFRSAAMAGQALPNLGFAVTNVYKSLIKDWARLTTTAVAKKDQAGDDIQDNTKLPAIIAGIDRLFGRHSPAALIVQTILLHMSLDVVQDWPQPAPLSKTEIESCIDAKLCPLLKLMMLADNDGWALFDRPTQAQYRQETLVVFKGIESLIDS